MAVIWRFTVSTSPAGLSSRHQHRWVLNTSCSTTNSGEAGRGMHNEPASPDHGAAPAPDAAATVPVAAPPSCGVVRRPVGAKSRRPRTQMLTSSEVNASSPIPVDIREIDEEALQQQQQRDLDNIELDFSIAVEITDCEPAAEAQDPEEAARPAARQLPRGAVPLMPLPFGAGGGGCGVFLRPRQLKPSQPPVPLDTTDSPADSTSTNSSPSPKPRRPPPPNAAAVAAAAVAAKLNMATSHGDSLKLPGGEESRTLRATSLSHGLADSKGDDRPQSSPSGHPPSAEQSPLVLKGDVALHAETPTPPPKLRRPPGTTPAAGAAPMSVLGAPDLLAMRQHLRRTAAPVFTSPPSEEPPPPVPQLRKVPAPQQRHQEQRPSPLLPPPQLPPKPLKRRPVKDDSCGNKATATLD